MATKHFILFVHYSENAVHSYDIEGLLNDNEYESVADYIEANGTDEVYEYDCDTERYLTEIRYLFVAECPEQPESYFRLNNAVEYDADDVDFERRRMVLPEEEFYAIQNNDNLVNIFDVEVDESEEFNIRKLCVIDSANSIVYNGKEYRVCACDGDDDGSFEYYLNGRVI